MCFLFQWKQSVKNLNLWPANLQPYQNTCLKKVPKDTYHLQKNSQFHQRFLMMKTAGLLKGYLSPHQEISSDSLSHTLHIVRCNKIVQFLTCLTSEFALICVCFYSLWVNCFGLLELFWFIVEKIEVLRYCCFPFERISWAHSQRMLFCVSGLDLWLFQIMPLMQSRYRTPRRPLPQYKRVSARQSGIRVARCSTKALLDSLPDYSTSQQSPDVSYEVVDGRLLNLLDSCCRVLDTLQETLSCLELEVAQLKDRLRRAGYWLFFELVSWIFVHEN